MNLDRIDIKVFPDSMYMALAKISDFSKLYTFISLNNVFSEQKINTGDKIQAFNFKNIEQFKGLRPFYAMKEDVVIQNFKDWGTEKSFKTKLKKGDLVKYNGIKYIVLGMVVNNYAQWNLPTPLLLNPTNINNDFKSLFSGRFTDEQVNNKINDNFQAGKYDADMLIPLVDANDFKDSIQVIEPAYTQEEAELIVNSISAERNLSVSAEKDVFINTMLKLRGNEINEIKETNQDLFKSMQDLLLSVNKAVNEQLQLAPKEKPAKKTRAKKVVEEIESIVEEPVIEEPKVVYPIVKAVEIRLYKPKGGFLEIFSNSFDELFEICQFIMQKLDTGFLRFNFTAITDSDSYTSNVEIRAKYNNVEFLSSIVEKFNSFVKPELLWLEFDLAKLDTENLESNKQIINDAFKKDPVEEKPKPEPKVEKSKVVTPKPVKVVAPKPEPKVEKPKVVTPKPVKVVAPKPEPKVVKPKPAPKEKIIKQDKKSDLSFLDDLDNIF